MLAIECGMGGRRSMDRFTLDGPWLAPEGHELPVVHWSQIEDAPGDISDCIPVGRSLVAVSDQDCCLVAIDHDDESFRAGEQIPLDKKIEKPEGLTVTSSGEWFVAMDTRDGAGALVRIADPEF